MVWQSTHLSPRSACTLSSQWICACPLWQAVQVAFASAGGMSLLKRRISQKPGASSSPSAATWSDMGPWQDSQPTLATRSATSALSSSARPWPFWRKEWSTFSWHSAQDSEPTYVAGSVVCESDGAMRKARAASRAPTRKVETTAVRLLIADLLRAAAGAAPDVHSKHGGCLAPCARKPLGFAG